MVEFGGIRAAVESIASKLDTLRAAVDALQDSGAIQTAIDELQASIEEIGLELDAIIADAQGSNTAGETPGPNSGPGQAEKDA